MSSSLKQEKDAALELQKSSLVEYLTKNKWTVVDHRTYRRPASEGPMELHVVLLKTGINIRKRLGNAMVTVFTGRYVTQVFINDNPKSRYFGKVIAGTYIL